MATKQCFINGVQSTILSASSTEYASVMGSGAFSNAYSTNENSKHEVVPNSATLRNLKIELSGSVTSGSLSVTLRKNGTDTALTISITSGTTAEDTTNSVTVTAGDLIAFKVVSSGLNSGLKMTGYSCEYESDNDNEFVIMCSSSFTLSGGGNLYNSLPSFGNWDNSPSPTDKKSKSLILPMDCTLKAIYWKLATAPGSGTNWSLRIAKNDTLEFSTQVTISNTATSGNVTGLSLSLSEADRIYWQANRVNSANATKTSFGILLTNTTDGQSIMGGVSLGDCPNSNGVTEYNHFERTGYGWNANELKNYSAIDFTMKKFRVYLEAAPTFLMSLEFYLRINGVDGNMGFSMTNTEQNKNDSVNTDSISALDDISIRCKSSIIFGSPSALWACWSAIQEILPPVTGNIPKIIDKYFNPL